MTIASEGYPIILGALVPGAILAGLYPTHGYLWLLVIGLILLCLGLASAAFFRNPRRAVPGDEGILVAPADGKVVGIHDVDDDYVGNAIRVDIFLSVLDVHINRIPAAGTVEFVEYRPGKFFSAFKDKASTDNERTDIGIVTEAGRLRVAQIAGLIARRIVCRVEKEQPVRRGRIYGMIRFGSRTELTFPRSFVPSVNVGQHVKGGETIIGKLSAHA